MNTQPVWLNGWMFDYKLSGCGCESHCSHLNFRCGACFKQVAPWHSSNYRVRIHSEMCMWHNKNIQSNALYRKVLTTQLKHRPVWLNGWLFVYELSSCGFKSHCSHLNFRFSTCFEQRVPWHSDNYRVWIYPEMCTWHDKNISIS